MTSALIFASFLLVSPAQEYGKLIHIDESGTTTMAPANDCSPLRDFRQISPAARARVVHYWRFVVLANADRIQRRRAQFDTDLTALGKSQNYSPATETAAAYTERSQRDRDALLSIFRADIQSIDGETMRSGAALGATLGPADRAAFDELSLPRICERAGR